MGNKITKNRSEIDKKYIWDLESMYQNDKQWENDIVKATKLANEFISHQGKIMNSSDTFLNAIVDRERIHQLLEKAFVYARMRMDEDNTDSKRQSMVDKITTAIASASSKMSFFTPEVLSVSSDTILSYLNNNPKMSQYTYYIETLLREKDHVLSKEEETLMANLSQVTGAPGAIFSMLNDGDIKFGEIENENGEYVRLTHGNYITFMESHNRELRKRAFQRVYETYKGLINTISTTYSYSVKSDVVNAKLRSYTSARAAAMSGGNIPEEVYDNLIDVVNDSLPNLHRYMKLRKRVLGLDKLQMWDVYVPMIELPGKEIPFELAVEIVLDAVKPLGDNYVSALQNGIESRWIDVYETQGKTSGAYSFGSYDSAPYSLMNYTGTLKDVFTLVHEMGHSMHSYYTRRTQPFTYGDHSIFTAEVASTVNESLLIKNLLDKETDSEMRKYLINFYLEEFRSTLFRQTMFAEFEKLTHAYVESGGSLTSDFMSREYKKLNDKYFGPALEDDSLIQYEWARIPHFYRGFYVYQYATGFSAATALSQRILEGGKMEREDYLEFLSLGSSKDPVDLLKIAGVDMSSPEPVRAAMKRFSQLVDQLETLV